MSEQSPPTSAGGGNRRSSLTEMFMSRPNMGQPSQSYSPPSPNTSSPSANTQSGRRGMSITTMGLGGANSQNTPLSAFARQRRASIASSTASGSPEFRNSFEDNAVIEEDSLNEVPANTPASPSFSRRVSFGAQALRDVKGSIPASGGEGFNWSEALRDRTRRQPSMNSGNNPFQPRQRAASVTTAEPPKEMPKPQSPTKVDKSFKPDFIGERMLRGDYMLD